MNLVLGFPTTIPDIPTPGEIALLPENQLDNALTVVSPDDGDELPSGNIDFVFELTNPYLYDDCYITINDSSYETDSEGNINLPAIARASYTITAELIFDGTYEWFITCKGSATLKSNTYDIVIDDSIPLPGSIDVDITNENYPSYPIEISVKDYSKGGFSRNSEVNLVIEYDDVKVKEDTITTVSGAIDYVFYSDSDADLGRYTVYLENADDDDENASGTFNLIEPEANIRLTGSVVVGDSLKIVGNGFALEDDVDLTVYKNTTKVKELSATTDDDGYFQIYYNTTSVGIFSVYAETSGTSIFNDTDSFEVIAQTTTAVTPPTAVTPSGGADAAVTPSGGADTSITPTVTSPPSVVNPPSPTDSSTNNLNSGSNDDHNNNDFVIDEPSYEPTEQKSSAWIWVLIGFLLVILIGGGVAGYMYYTNQHTDSSIDAINMPPIGSSNIAPSNIAPSNIAPPVNDDDMVTLSNFINGERSKGYDDLTIRNALLQKGWEEIEVDHVFDEMYKH